MVPAPTLQMVTLTIGASSVYFYNFLGESASTFEQKVNALQPYFSMMPTSHVEAVYPMLIIPENPYSSGGGTFRRREAGNVSRRVSSTGVSEEILQQILTDSDKGVCVVPRDRWDDDSKRHFTVLHEAAHCIDYQLRLSPGRHLRPVSSSIPVDDPSTRNRNERRDFIEQQASEIYKGVRPTCGGHYYGMYTAEAYARMVITPQHICRDSVAPESQSAADQRIIDALWSSAAFRNADPSTCGLPPPTAARSQQVIPPTPAPASNESSPFRTARFSDTHQFGRPARAVPCGPLGREQSAGSDPYAVRAHDRFGRRR
jgi:hypothetical protein